MMTLDELRRNTYRGMHPFAVDDGPPLACPWHWWSPYRSSMSLDVLLDHVATRVDADDLAVLTAAVDLLRDIVPGGLTPAAVETLSAGICHRLQAVWAPVLASTVGLARTQEPAQRLIEELSVHRQADVRLRTVQCLKRTIPAPVLYRILEPRLSDASSNVRLFTAQQAYVLRLHDLVDPLRVRLPNEQHPKVRSTLEIAISYLTKGWLVRKSASSWNISKLTPDGGTVGWRSWDHEPSDVEVETALAERAEEEAVEAARWRRIVHLKSERDPIRAMTGNVVFTSAWFPFRPDSTDDL